MWTVWFMYDPYSRKQYGGVIDDERLEKLLTRLEKHKWHISRAWKTKIVATRWRSKEGRHEWFEAHKMPKYDLGVQIPSWAI